MWHSVEYQSVTSRLETFLVFLEDIIIVLKKFGLKKEWVSVSKSFSLKKVENKKKFGLTKVLVSVSKILV